MNIDFIDFFSNYPWTLLLVAAWTLPWKGIALWKAARNESISWFIALLIINTLGILEIVYIFYFSGKQSALQNFEADKIRNFEKRVLDIKRGKP